MTGIRYVAYVVPMEGGERVQPDSFDSAAKAWAYWGQLRMNADAAWTADGSIDQTQAIIESFERKAEMYGILGTGEVLDEPTGIVYGVRAEDEE
jgi:hypothetical protein